MYYGWKIVWLACGLTSVSFGIGFYGVALYLVQLDQAHGFGIAPISSAITYYYLLGAVGTVFAGDLFARFGPRKPIACAVVMLSTGVISLGYLTSLAELYLAFTLLAAGWSLTNAAAINLLVAPWFDDKRGFALSIALSGASVAGIVFVPVWTYLVQSMSFTETTSIIGAAALIGLTPFVIRLLGRPTASAAETARALTPVGSESDDLRLTAGALLTSHHFWSICGPFGIAQMAQVALLTHQIALLMPYLGAAGSALSVGIASFAAFAGRLIFMLFVDRFDMRRLACANFLIQIAGVTLMIFIREPLVLYLGFGLLGFGVGNTVTLPGLVLQGEFAPRDFTRAISLVVAIGQFLFAFGPGLVGWSYACFGSYDVALSVCVGGQVAAAGAILIRPNTRETVH